LNYKKKKKMNFYIHFKYIFFNFKEFLLKEKIEKNNIFKDELYNQENLKTIKRYKDKKD
jgi:hypothetical protein